MAPFIVVESALTALESFAIHHCSAFLQTSLTFRMSSDWTNSAVAEERRFVAAAAQES